MFEIKWQLIYFLTHSIVGFSSTLTSVSFKQLNYIPFISHCNDKPTTYSYVKYSDLCLLIFL